MYQTEKKWFVLPKRNPQAKLRLFCFPYAGGGASVYRSWADTILDKVELCAVQLPGRESRFTEPLYEHMTPLVTKLAEDIRPYLDKPFAFFGHSLGACIGFELARQLRRNQVATPAHVFISGCSPPQYPVKRPIHNLSQEEFVDELRQLNGTPESVLRNEELMNLVLPILRKDFGIRETYQCHPEPPLNSSLSILGGNADQLVPVDELPKWQTLFQGEYEQHIFSGHHFFLHSENDAVLQCVNQTLLKVNV